MSYCCFGGFDFDFWGRYCYFLLSFLKCLFLLFIAGRAFDLKLQIYAILGVSVCELEICYT